MSNPYGPAPKPGSVFPALSGEGGYFVVSDVDYDDRFAAALLLEYLLGENRVTSDQIDVVAPHAEAMVLFRVLAEQGTINDCEPGMWHTDGQGTALFTIFFPESALEGA